MCVLPSYDSPYGLHPCEKKSSVILSVSERTDVRAREARHECSNPIFHTCVASLHALKVLVLLAAIINIFTVQWTRSISRHVQVTTAFKHEQHIDSSSDKGLSQPTPCRPYLPDPLWLLVIT